MDNTYKYDAFISYRHLAPDKPIAQRLQKLLESYTPPQDVRKSGRQKTLHLFRDETELPTSSDLGSDIRTALESSRYLVVICSPEFEKSKWCMEEVAYFKELHGGSNRNIITVLADDPDRRPYFPDILRFETVTRTLETGETVTAQEETEPLAANVCAKTQAQMLKKLNTEFLRVAAPLIGCGFDDLYKREQRRRTKRILTVTLSTAAVFAVATLLSVVALLTISSQKQQIEETAAALQSSNEELLIRESGMLEKDGDLYGALDAAARAIPDEGTAPAGAVGQCVSLLGAYEPDSFAAFRKITLPTTPDDFYLLNDGKTLAVKSGSSVSLWDTQSGEQIVSCDGISDAAFLINPQIETAGMTEVEKGWVKKTQADGVDLYTMYSKDIQAEKPVGSDSGIFIINDNDKTVSRISAADGTPLWTVSVDYARFPSDDMPCGDTIAVETLRELLLLDTATGAVKVRYDLSALKSVTDFFLYDIYPVDDYLILTSEKDLAVRCVVCRATPTQPEVLLRTTLFEGSTLGHTAFSVSGQTLCAAGFYFTDILDHGTAFFKGYDLNTGAVLWSAEEENAVSGTPMTGFIAPDKGASNAYPAAFAAVGNRLFAVDAASGDVIVNQALPGCALQLYYSENGFIFITSENGTEYVFPLRKLKSGEKVNVYYYLNRSFQTALKNAAYCSNIYAASREGETSVILYRVIPNDTRRTVYRLPEEARSSISSVSLSPDKSLAAVIRSKPAELAVLETATAKVRQTIPFDEMIHSVCFFGNDRLAVQVEDTLQIRSISTGKTEQTFPVERLSGRVFTTPERLVFQEKDGAIRIAAPGQKPKELSSSSTDKVDLLSLSDSGQYLLLKTTQYAVAEARYRLHIINLDTGKTVSCEAISALSENAYSPSAAWSPSEAAVYLLWNDTVVGFSCADGSALCEAPAPPESNTLLFVRDSLCILDEPGLLTRMQVHKTHLTPVQQMNLVKSTQGLNWTFVRGQGEWDYLFSRDSYGAYAHCAVIDTSSFEIVYRLDWCCGIDEQQGLIYNCYYDCFDAYPILDAAQLKARANAQIGK